MTRIALFVLLATSFMTAPGQSDISTISTTFASGEIPEPPDHTFGIAMDPDGQHAYVTVSGGLGFGGPPNNHRVLKIHIPSRTIVASGDVGNFPEGIAIRIDGAGVAQSLFITDNSDSSIHVLTPALNVVDFINLGTCVGPFGASGHFPFPLVFTPDQNTLFVGTLGCGDILAVDTDPASATPHAVSTAINMPGAHSALCIAPSGDTLYVGSSIINPAFNAASPVLYIVDLTQSPPSSAMIPIAAETLFDFASIQDINILPDGRLLLVENSAFHARLYVFDPTSQVVVDAFDLQTRIPGLTSLHQADLSPDGRIAAIASLDLAIGQVAFFDVASRNLISSQGFPVGHQPSFANYTLDGSEILVSFQSAEELRVIGAIPEALDLSVNAPASLGTTFDFVVGGTPPFSFAALFLSVAGPGPTSHFGFHVALSEPFVELAILGTDAMGVGIFPAQVPASPAFLGLQGHLQAVTSAPAGLLRLSEPLSVTVVQ